MRSEDESTVGGYCWVFNVSTVFVQTCGLVARIQLQIQEQSAELEELKEMILAEKRDADKKNFDEAVQMISKASQPTKVPEHIEELFNNPHCNKVPWYDGRFWLLNPNHKLPLSGIVPDMKANTKNYKLQSIYRQQASEDLEKFKSILKETYHFLRKQPREEEEEDETPKYHEEPEDLISRFTKECKPGNDKYAAHWYLAFKAMSSYQNKNKGEYPGMRKGQEEKDLTMLSDFAINWLKLCRWVNAVVDGKVKNQKFFLYYIFTHNTP
ncbi:hypothetical protein PTTG_02992 [Puccinia triticina 1-1 BBBD Race 1]|uniref:Uncharacterized protein n=1 Tax=Puccinia triticina (isolate 1-1 / race 1 (BBBD)) TaxID=630390 RepID=A0A0C4EQD4_PUCT1|nr:hypothetical protein PTTG_02992 [Puccinia triticina 1-1 BBBD Race 1]